MVRERCHRVGRAVPGDALAPQGPCRGAAAQHSNIRHYRGDRDLALLPVPNKPTLLP